MPGGTGPNHARFGSLGRDTFRGPGYRNFDVALIKDTRIGRRGKGELGTLEFRTEFFNVFSNSRMSTPSLASITIRGPHIGETVHYSRQKGSE